MAEPIQFRPHHFLCALGYSGKGYSPSFIEGFDRIVQCLRSNRGEETQIEVVDHSDSICGPCPHRRGSRCETENQIQELDRRHARVLEIESNQVLSWGEAKARILEKMSLERFHSACEGCEWKSLGYCENALRELRGSLNE